jgi:hypothetical protein
MASRYFPAAWSRFFGLTSAPQVRAAPPPKQPAPQAPRVLSREALEVEWLLRCLPRRMQAALVPDLLALKRARPFTGPLPVDD